MFTPASKNARIDHMETRGMRLALAMTRLTDLAYLQAFSEAGVDRRILSRMIELNGRIKAHL